MTLRSSMLLLTATLALAGCVVESPQPTEELTRARTMVAQADKADAQREAAADLQRAHDELTDAEKANGERKYDEARRYAESAAVDADLATARAGAAAAHRAEHEVAQSNETLREQSDPGSGVAPRQN